MLYNAADNVINIRDIHKPRGRALDIFDPRLPSWTVLLNKDNIVICAFGQRAPSPHCHAHMIYYAP